MCASRHDPALCQNVRKRFVTTSIAKSVQHYDPSFS